MAAEACAADVVFRSKAPGAFRTPHMSTTRRLRPFLNHPGVDKEGAAAARPYFSAFSARRCGVPEARESRAQL